jgi:hypothetical protein
MVIPCGPLMSWGLAVKLAVTDLPHGSRTTDEEQDLPGAKYDYNELAAQHLAGSREEGQTACTQSNRVRLFCRSDQTCPLALCSHSCSLESI